MDSSLVGILIGFFLVFYAIFSGGDVLSFWDFDSILITVGGTIGATIASYPWSTLKNIPKVLGTLKSQRTWDPGRIIEVLVGYAEKARREGLLALEDDIETMGEPFLQKGIQLIVDGTDPELVRSILETELTFIEDRHNANASVFDTMGALAPGFGMLGTLIGLIQMLRNIDDPSSIGPGMAVALITTFYGSLISNMICLPIASKLRSNSRAEILLKEVMIEGVLSIQAGENPRIVEEKLKAFLAASRKSVAPSHAGEVFTVEGNE
ncbi:MAG: motility protein A [Firmicutes bacterium]|nr:motility protein A [Bacillota bacterium]